MDPQALRLEYEPHLRDPFHKATLALHTRVGHNLRLLDIEYGPHLWDTTYDYCSTYHKRHLHCTHMH